MLSHNTTRYPDITLWLRIFSLYSVPNAGGGWGWGGNRYKLLGSGSLEGGLGPNYIAYVFVFLSSVSICQLYKLTLADQAQITLQVRVSLSYLV